ncbi:hypothetical protein [Kaistia sp. MMO-174]|uniref:hypothetical protein n=1 Tax=Kaistia sp. MMO-174 TaxID=3081256 RepID=UPI003016E69F
MTDHVTPRFRKGDVVQIEATVESCYDDHVTLRPTFGHAVIYAVVSELRERPLREAFEVGDTVARIGEQASWSVEAIVGDYLIVKNNLGPKPHVLAADSARRVYDEPEPKPPLAAAIAAVDAYNAQPPVDAMPDALDEAGL